MASEKTAEELRLEKQHLEAIPTALWGPYLSERQWGTVREDYSSDGNAWDYFTHDQARSRAYRWGEDGIAGISDSQCQLCFALSLWNGKDPILKERLFGLSNRQGNHGEDVKELYYYLDNTPTHSYMQYLYKYPQDRFPYDLLATENGKRDLPDEEYELLDTGIFSNNRYFDITVTYAKSAPEEIMILIEAINRGDSEASLHILPVLWFRKQWSPDLIRGKPFIKLARNSGGINCANATHPNLGSWYLYFDPAEKYLFTENETNTFKLFSSGNESQPVKDSFHAAVINNDFRSTDGRDNGTKFSPFYRFTAGSGQKVQCRLRITREAELRDPFSNDFESAFANARKEADEFYGRILPDQLTPIQKSVVRQAFAGMLWNKQFYYYDVRTWLKGDRGQIPPPGERLTGRNSKWKHLNNRDIISVPDKWEFPWYASWDLAFHMIVFARIDPGFAKNQMILINREWYTHPNGQIPAYEWNFSDVNPPVQAWAAMRIYEIEKTISGKGDIDFLKRIFQKLNIYFTWWTNQKDAEENYIFEGGFLGLDNIGVIDRDAIIKHGFILEQADGTAWMGMFATYMLEIALEISHHDDTYQDVALKYFEQYGLIAEALNTNGLWDEEQGFFFDVLKFPDGRRLPLKVRSTVGLTPMFAALYLPQSLLSGLKQFIRDMDWERKYSSDLGLYSIIIQKDESKTSDKLLSLFDKEKLARLLGIIFDEDEFLSPFGIRSLSKKYSEEYRVIIDGEPHTLKYAPGESDTPVFGNNSNWRGPIWFPINYLIIGSLKIYHQYFQDDFKVEFPTRSGNWMNLKEIADQLTSRLQNIFLPGPDGNRPVFGRFNEFYRKEENKNLVLFHEYFHGETGMGLGASHQTGWTGLIAALIAEMK